MPYRVLGRTGIRVSALGLGGSHIGDPKLSRAAAIRIIHAAIDGGLTFMDNSWDYHEGESEVRLGKSLKGGYRSRAFVMTKVDGRTKKEAARQLDQSLKRLGLDEIDLLQHHEVIRFDDVDRSSHPAGPWRLLSRHEKPGRSALSASRDTRIPRFTYTCLKPPGGTGFVLTRFKCHSISWTRTFEALKRKSYPSWSKPISGSWE
jgi:hypothetical protein